MIRASVNYFDPAVARGRFDLIEPERNLMRFEAHAVEVHDLRDQPQAIDGAGFTLARHTSRVAFDPAMLDTNITAQDGLPPINQAYYDEMLPSICEISGARDVIPQATGLTVRFSARSERQSWAGAAGFIHLDVTESSVTRFLDTSLKAAGRSVAPYRRFVLYQTWRAVSDPPQDNLLTLCDRRTVGPGDVVFYDAVLGDEGSGLDDLEARGCRYNPAHRWWYAPAMGAEDVLVFVGYDSADPRAVQPFHTGFDVPGEEDAPPRRSLEARFFAFYD